MAYLDIAQELPGLVAGAPSPIRAATRFSALEWQVIALAERDHPSSLRRPGRLSVALGVLFATPNPRLADPRLEALRRMAVLSWRKGYTVPPHEVRAFTTAGFSLEQYELMLDSIDAARAERRRAA